MADPFNVVNAIFVIVNEIHLAIGKSRRSKRRLVNLLERVDWFADKFREIQMKRVIREQDLKVMLDFKSLLEDIAQFTEQIESEGWMKRLWHASSNEDAIDDFNARLEDARNDLIFIFATDTPLPRSWAQGDEEDVREMLVAIKEGDPRIVEEELKRANLKKESVIRMLECKYRESLVRSQNLEWRENLVSSFSCALRPHDFRPSLLHLTKERFPTLVIGEGSFGVVFKCQWRGDLVAVKVLKLQNLSRKALGQLTEEMRIMSALGAHKNVINVFGLIAEPLCMVMNYASRGSLRQNLDMIAASATSTFFTAETRWRWANEIAGGMAWLHSATPPIIHRDLKSDNILMDEDGRLLVSDFGCAVAKSETKSVSLHESDMVKDGKKHSIHNAIAGSIPWMPPEAFATGRQNAEGDVYAYGIVLWEILTGSVPWEGIHPALVPSLVQGGQRPSLSIKETAGEKDDTSEFAHLIRDCWDGDPQKRPPFAHIKLRTGSMLSCLMPHPPPHNPAWARANQQQQQQQCGARTALPVDEKACASDEVILMARETRSDFKLTEATKLPACEEVVATAAKETHNPGDLKLATDMASLAIATAAMLTSPRKPVKRYNSSVLLKSHLPSNAPGGGIGLDLKTTGVLLKSDLDGIRPKTNLKRRFTVGGEFQSRTPLQQMVIASLTPRAMAGPHQTLKALLTPRLNPTTPRTTIPSQPPKHILELRMADSGGSLGSSVISSPPAILVSPSSLSSASPMQTGMFPLANSKKSSGPSQPTNRHLQGNTAPGDKGDAGKGWDNAKLFNNFDPMFHTLDHSGVAGVCEWLERKGALEVNDLGLVHGNNNPTWINQVRDIVKDILSVEDNCDDLCRHLNEIKAKNKLDQIQLVVAGLREFFKSLREPVTTFALYDTLIQLGLTHAAQDDALARDLCDLYTRIPEPNISWLKSIVVLLSKTNPSLADRDKLSFEWGPVLFRPEVAPSASDSVLHTKVIMRVCRVMIDKHDLIFASTTQDLDPMPRNASSSTNHRRGSIDSRGSGGEARSQRRLLISSSSSSTLSMASKSFKKRVIKPFANGLQGFVRVFPPPLSTSSSTRSNDSSTTGLYPSMSSASLLSSEELFVDGGSFRSVGSTMTDLQHHHPAQYVGLDPVSKVRLTEDDVYARDGDICFQSVATQNFYYKMLDAGHKFENGNFVEAKQSERVWTLRSSKGDYAVLGGSSKNRLLSLLVNLNKGDGKHTLSGSIEDHHKDSLAYFTKPKGVTALVQLLANDQPLGSEAKFPLSSLSETSFRFLFTVPKADTLDSSSSAIVKYQLRITFETVHVRRRFLLRASLDKVPTPKHRLGIAKALALSKQILLENEIIAEIEKDAFGLGLGLVWSPENHGMMIKSIEPGGAASKSSRIAPGDIIRAVMGVRVDDMEYGEVARMLRNIPLVAVLVLYRPIHVV